jgi:hypothetical protein
MRTIDFNVDERFRVDQHALEVGAPRLRLRERLAFVLGELRHL